jgi:Leucine-rich repeat (LRR) protein
LLLLQELDLSHNSLAELPGSISSLTGLTALRLNHNQLSSLPKELTALHNLALFDARWAFDL